ncbi:MAG: hypothetical protein AB8I08_10545 [Sandaracinaceae bacterium]
MTRLSARAAVLGVLVLGVSVLGGCLPQRLSGHFGEAAYYHHRDHYRVRYADGHAEARHLLDAPWRLANFEADENGRPSHVPTGEENASLYDRQRYVSGRGRRTFRLARYDLEYRHADNGSVVYARTVPLRHPWTDDTLPVLMRRTIASLLTPGADAPDLLGRTLGTEALQLRILREGPTTVDGQPAHAIRFALRTGEDRQETITLVGVKARRPLRQGRRVPAMVVFGLISAPGDHAAGQDALVSLVSRVDLNPPD